MIKQKLHSSHMGINSVASSPAAAGAKVPSHETKDCKVVDPEGNANCCKDCKIDTSLPLLQVPRHVHCLVYRIFLHEATFSLNGKENVVGCF